MMFNTIRFIKTGILLVTLTFFLSCSGNPVQSINNEKAEFLYNQVILVYLNGNLPQAEQGFKELSRQYPKFVPSYIMLGKSLFYQDKLKEARQIFLKSVKIQKNVLSFVWLGKIALLQKQNKEAYQYLLQALALDYSNPLAHYEMAKYQQQQGKIEKAVYHYNYAISYENMYPEMKFDLAMLYKELSMNDKARELLNAVLKANISEPMKTNITKVLSNLGK